MFTNDYISHKRKVIIFALSLCAAGMFPGHNYIVCDLLLMYLVC